MTRCRRQSRTAARTVEGIYERAQLLKQHPEAGYRYELNPTDWFEFSSTVTIESPI
jgi:hypothetical protein